MVHGTKAQILVLLKRSGGASVEELASNLDLASMTVRQHLSNLERDGLVDAVEVRRPLGRPHHRFRLTELGERTFPKRFDRLARLLMQEISEIDPSAFAGLPGDERRSLLLAKLADRLIKQYAPRVEGRSLQDRVEVVTQILQEESGFAEWSRVAGGFEIRDLNCPYRQLLGSSESVCAWHVRLLSQLLGREVVDATDGRPGVDCCRYAVPEQATGIPALSRQAQGVLS